MQRETTETTPTADILLAALTGLDYDGLHANPQAEDALISLHLFGQFTSRDAGRDTYAGYSFWSPKMRRIIRGALAHYRKESDSGYALSVGDTRSAIDRALAGCEARADLVSVILAAEAK